MCCRISISPCDDEIAELILTVGQFKPIYWSPGHPERALNWERLVPEEGTVVHASLSAVALQLHIAPAISAYSQHEGKRTAAGIYFEIAAKFAEKVGGRIVQHANVIGCKEPNQPGELFLAQYPDQPLGFERICRGFQALFVNIEEVAK